MRIGVALTFEPFDSSLVRLDYKLSFVNHKKYLFVIIPQRGTKKAHRNDGLMFLLLPIVLPLAPCFAVGCCVVVGTVPRTLFMVNLI